MYAPPPPSPTRPRWLLPAGIGCGGLLLVLIVLGIIGAVAGPLPEETSAAPTRTPSTAASAPTSSKLEPPPLPPYRIVKDDKRGYQRYLTVEVDALPPGDGLRKVFDDIRRKHDEPKGYFVSIDCSTGGTKYAANRLANGRFSVGAEGEASTGLNPGQSEFDAVDGARCPDEAAPTPVSSTKAVPSPDAAEQRAYLAAIERIDPGLVVNEERAMRRAHGICDRIINPPKGSNITLEHYTSYMLSGGNATIDEEQAKQVIKAVKAWCH